MARLLIWVSDRVSDHVGMPRSGIPAAMLRAMFSMPSPYARSMPTKGVPWAAPSSFAPWQTAQWL